MSDTTSIVLNFFIIGAVSLTIVLTAFGAALVMSQRRRLRMHREYSQRILSAHEEERAWVARELHDDLLQRVALIRHELDALWAGVANATDADTLRLQALNGELADLGIALRNVAHRLHPTIVDQIGLPRALEALGGEFRKAGSLEVAVTAVGAEASIPPAVAHAAYRIAQEALRNIVKHAGVNAAGIELSTTSSRVILRVRDRGRGFSLDANRGEGIGLASMRERAALVKGTVTVTSREGEGTTIEASLPLVEVA